MKFYGGYGEHITGTHDGAKKFDRGISVPAVVAPVYIPRGKTVIRWNEDGETYYPSVSVAAKAAGVEQPTMSAWLRDGKEHRGYHWRVCE